MTLRDPLARVLLGWALATAVACVLVRHAFALDLATRHVVVASLWSEGRLVGRAALAHAGDQDPALDTALAGHPGATLVYETVVGEGPVLTRPAAAFALSFVPARDGIAVTLGDRTEYLTPDELLSRQAFDQGFEIPSLGFKAGLDVTLALAIFADRFDITVPDLLDRATVRRIRVERSLPGERAPRVITADTMTRDDVRDGAVAAGPLPRARRRRERALPVPRRRTDQPHAAGLRLAAARRGDVLPRPGRRA